MLNAFKVQIEFGFDTQTIERQQEEVLDLISSEVKEKEIEAWKELMKKEVIMNNEDS